MVIIKNRKVDLAAKKNSGIKKPINFKVRFHNVGPINSGEIEVKPLTILIGPNQSGKSYAAMLIYSIINSKFENSKNMNHSFSSYITEHEDKKFRERIDSLNKNDSTIKDLELKQLFKSIYKRVMKKRNTGIEKKWSKNIIFRNS
jgi:predicted ATPase